jgi:hypothetical protein
MYPEQGRGAARKFFFEKKGGAAMIMLNNTCQLLRAAGKHNKDIQ